MNLSRALILLVLAAILPLIVFAAVLGVYSVRQQRDATEREAVAKVDQVAAFVDRELAAQTRVLQAVAASPLLAAEPLDRPAVRAYFAQVLAQQPTWRRLYISKADGENLVTEPLNEDGSNGRIIEPLSLNKVFATRMPAIGLVSKRAGSTAAVPIRAPVVRDGRVAHAVSALVEPSSISRLLREAEVPDTWLGAVVDGRGVFVARTLQDAERVATPGSPALRAAVARGGSGLYPGVSLEGVPIVTAYRTLPDSGWSVHIAMPQSLYTASSNRTLMLVGGGGAVVFLALCLFLWLLFREFESRNRRAQALQEGHRLEALGRITGGVAHDFNNLLMIVHGGAEAIKRNIDKPERTAPFVDAILNAAERGKTLTRELLAFGRRSSHELVSFRLQDRINTLKDVLEKSTRSDITTSVFIPAEVNAIYADPSALEIALINLAVNARDAMPDGGHLALTAFNANFERRDAKTGLLGEFVAVVMADSGPGIPKAQLSRIFEPFYTTKPAGKGTGLGLSQVYGFVQQSGGTVTVDSAEGEGASFTLYLPRAPHEPILAAAPSRPASGKAEGHILVVEDNSDVSLVTQALLRQFGYEVSWADSGAVAIEMMRGGSRADLVLSDILMPGMSGLELAAQLQTLRPGLPIVLMTGFSDAMAEGLAARRTVLQKPFTADQLADALAEALDHRAAAKA